MSKTYSFPKEVSYDGGVAGFSAQQFKAPWNTKPVALQTPFSLELAFDASGETSPSPLNEPRIAVDPGMPTGTILFICPPDADAQIHSFEDLVDYYQRNPGKLAVITGLKAEPSK